METSSTSILSLTTTRARNHETGVFSIGKIDDMENLLDFKFFKYRNYRHLKVI